VLEVGYFVSLQEVEHPRKVEICANRRKIAVSEDGMVITRDSISQLTWFRIILLYVISIRGIT